MRIGNVFVDKPCRLVLGQLSWQPRYSHCMFGADLSTLLPLCRQTKAERIHAACLPFANVEEPPFIHGDLQLCLPHEKRLKVGWIYTDSAQEGVVYQLLLERQVFLDRWGLVWVHISPEDKDNKETTDEQTDTQDDNDGVVAS